MEKNNMNNLTFDELEKYRNAEGCIVVDSLIAETGKIEPRGTVSKDKKWYECKDGAVLLKMDMGEDAQNHIYSELISCELAKQVGRKTARYDVVEYKGKKGLITQNICIGHEELVSINELVGCGEELEGYEDTTDIYELFDALEEKFQIMGLSIEQIDKCMLDLRKQLLFDLCVMETDRHTENLSYIFGTDENGKQTVGFSPMYDTESSLALYCDEQTMYKISGSIDKTEFTTNIQEPKISVIPEPEEEREPESLQTTNSFVDFLKQDVNKYAYQTPSEQMWKETLDFLCEDEEAKKYLEDTLMTMDIRAAIQSVEQRLKISLPTSIKSMARECFDNRKSSMKWEIGMIQEENEKEVDIIQEL